MGGVCANCYYEKGYCYNTCDLREKSNVSSGSMSATMFFELLIRTVPTSRRRNTAARNIALQPRVGSKSEVNKDFNSSDNLKGENPSLETD